jgi:SAM-dependent methyltransferase
MKALPFGLLAAALAVSCARSEERTSRVGTSVYDPPEELVPASGSTPPRPDPTIEKPLGPNADQTSEPATESSTSSDPPVAADSATTPGAESNRSPDVIYVPTPQPIVDKMLDLARIQKDDLVYDLGCGDGRIVVTAAKRYGARAVGFEIDPARVTEARANVKKNKVEHLVSIEQKDIFTVDLSPATVVTLYLLPELNNRLLPQLEKLAPGARVVSHDYDIAGVVPTRSLGMTPRGEDREHSVFFYTLPFERARSLSLPPAPVRGPIP